MSECEFISKCPIFEKCQTGAIKKIYSMNYCLGKHLDECERRKLKKAGKEVPLSLLPDGHSLSC